MASILSLPLHLIAGILSQLDNIRQLPSALLSHPIFYSALLDTPTLPLDILRNSIPSSLLPLAIVTHESQNTIRESDGLGVEAFLAECYDKAPRDINGSQLRLGVALALQLGNVHGIISELSNDFALCSLRRIHGLGKYDPIPDGQEVSPTESYRISRAFYRLQIYRNLFLNRKREFHLFINPGDHVRDYLNCDKAQKDIFFGRHSPWVNEQLACVYDYLESRLPGAYEQVVVNDFPWGSNLTEWVAEKTHRFEKQKCLSWGIPRLTQLLKESTYEEWQNHVVATSSHRQSSLEEDLEEFNRRMRTNDKRGLWRMADMNRLAREVDVDDVTTDDHPRRIWTAVHYDQVDEIFRLGDYDFAPMRCIPAFRSIGYVMWDGERMQDEECTMRLNLAYLMDTVFEAYS